MDDVLGSVIVTERLKTRKSLATNYWEDIISGVEVKSNDRNVKNLWKVSTSFQVCAIFHLKTTFSIHEKYTLAKICPPGFYGPVGVHEKVLKSNGTLKKRYRFIMLDITNAF